MITPRDPLVPLQLPLSLLPLLSKCISTEVSAVGRMLAHTVGQAERNQLLDQLSNLAKIVSIVSAAALEQLKDTNYQPPEA